jgi:UPF0716 protein FxsA
MLIRLALLFITIPLVELALLVWLGSLVGFWPTMALVVITGIAGAALARAAGLQVVRQIRSEIAAGRMPVNHLLDGLLVLVGGVVLLTPGLLTDLVGLALLIPPTRSAVRSFLQRKLQRLVESRRVEMVGFDGRPIDLNQSGGRPVDVNRSGGRPVD